MTLALGIFAGACAQLVYQDSWRAQVGSVEEICLGYLTDISSCLQVTSGAAPAFLLAVMTYVASEYVSLTGN